MMAQRAELEYIDFLEAVKADAEGNPFEGEANVLSDLAARFIKAQIGINEFKESLSQLEKTVNTYIEKANEFLKAGFEKAYQFDGTDDTLVFEAIEDLQTSSEFLGKAVVNLYNPQEVRRVVEELVGETVERMEMEKELGIEEE